MSPEKDKNSLNNYNTILAPLVYYLQSINTWYEYLVFTSMLAAILIGLDVFSNEGKILEVILPPYTTGSTLSYQENERYYITSVNLRYPTADLAIIPCRSTWPRTHRVLKVLGCDGDMCRVLIINKEAPQTSIDQTLQYFKCDNKYLSPGNQYPP